MTGAGQPITPGSADHRAGQPHAASLANSPPRPDTSPPRPPILGPAGPLVNEKAPPSPVRGAAPRPPGVPAAGSAGKFPSRGQALRPFVPRVADIAPHRHRLHRVGRVRAQ